MLVCLTACSVNAEKPTISIEDSRLDLEEVPVIQEKALTGDGNEALKLSLFYNIGSKAEYWAGIAAQNGSVEGCYNYGYFLSRKNDRQSKLRALFWLKKALEGGVEEAPSLIRIVQDEISVE